MNYRHVFHAGNFADVFKHSLLLELLNGLAKKDTPFDYLETHAGAGLYDLQSEWAQKTQEYALGAEKVVAQCAAIEPAEPTGAVPGIIQEYVALLKEAGYPERYPGSPWLARQRLRAEDKLILIEKHPEEVQKLKHCFVGEPRAAVHQRDAYEGLGALLPLKARRGLVLIDPPYESPKEWEDLTTAVVKGLQRFRQGVFAIWYPIKAENTFQAQTEFLRQQLPSAIAGLVFRLNAFNNDVKQGLRGSGLIVLNPPWPLEQRVRAWLPWLWNVLSYQGQGDYAIEVF